MTVTIANHGRDAVNRLDARPDGFDGVLMDIQMPIMDGYCATREIRRDGRFERLPIIAMTANAMAQDRKQALEAGMNDHVAKPIDVKALFDVLGRWIEVPGERRSGTGFRAHEPVAEASGATGAPELEGIDTVDALGRVGGNSPLYLKILRQFRDGQAKAVARIRAAIEAGDKHTARREAHTLKGLAGNVGAHALYQAAERVEHLFRGDESADAIETPVTELQVELARVIAVLGRLGDSGGGPLTNGLAAEAPDDSRDISQVPALLAQLRELLEDDDAGADQPVALLMPLLAGSSRASLMTELADHVDNYDFDAALDAMVRLEAQFQSHPLTEEPEAFWRERSDPELIPDEPEP
jgi:CheY-like chemotaxis protein